MTKAIQLMVQHSPTLNTVLMVEGTIMNAKDSVVTVAEIKKLLPKQVNHTTLKTILIYLEESGKIAVSMKGITWIHNSNPRLRKAIVTGRELRELDKLRADAMREHRAGKTIKIEDV